MVRFRPALCGWLPVNLRRQGWNLTVQMQDCRSHSCPYAVHIMPVSHPDLACGFGNVQRCHWRLQCMFLCSTWAAPGARCEPGLTGPHACTGLMAALGSWCRARGGRAACLSALMPFPPSSVGVPLCPCRSALAAAALPCRCAARRPFCPPSSAAQISRCSAVHPQSGMRLWCLVCWHLVCGSLLCRVGRALTTLQHSCARCN